MGVFRKQGVFWIDYYADGHHKCERIGLDKHYIMYPKNWTGA
jgi:hypothetical protein